MPRSYHIRGESRPQHTSCESSAASLPWLAFSVLCPLCTIEDLRYRPVTPRQREEAARPAGAGHRDQTSFSAS